MALEARTLILLIDFKGHPILAMDELTNNLRYNYLMELLQLQTELNIVSDHIVNSKNKDHHRIEHIKEIYDIEGLHNWDVINSEGKKDIEDGTDWIHYIENIFEKRGYAINNVIIGGTNTAGCVLRSKPYSAIHWAKKGYPVQIYLPMCADYQLPGVNQAERNMAAGSILYNVIREEKLWNNIDLVRKRSMLEIL